MNPKLQEALCDSLESAKLLMSTTFQRLVLKDVPFEIYEAASQHQMSGLWNFVSDMDPILKPHEGKERYQWLPKVESLH